MTRLITASVTLLLGLLLIASSAQSPVASQGGTIGGHVFDASRAVPLAGITVQACSAKSSCYYSYTREDGWYQIGILPYDSYRVYAEGDLRCGDILGYGREYWREKTNEAEADLVTISATSLDAQNIDFTLVLYDQYLYLPVVVETGVETDEMCSRFDAPGNDEANLNQEWVCLANHGPKSVDLEKWYVTSDQPLRYTLPAFTLAQGAIVRLRSGPGSNTLTDLYWGQTTSLWHNFGSTVCLYNAHDYLIDE